MDAALARDRASRVAAADAALDPRLLSLCHDCGLGPATRLALHAEGVLDVETLGLALADDLLAPVLGAREAALLRRAVDLLAEADAAHDAQFFWDDD